MSTEINVYNDYELLRSVADEAKKCMTSAIVGRNKDEEIVKEKRLGGGDTKIIQDYCFANCQELREVTIKDSVEKIGIYAFKNCMLLQKVVISPLVKEIGEGAFDGCFLLKSVRVTKEQADMMLKNKAYGLDGFKICFEENGKKAYYEITGIIKGKNSILKKIVDENGKVVEKYLLNKETNTWIDKTARPKEIERVK